MKEGTCYLVEIFGEDGDISSKRTYYSRKECDTFIALASSMSAYCGHRIWITTTKQLETNYDGRITRIPQEATQSED